MVGAQETVASLSPAFCPERRQRPRSAGSCGCLGEALAELQNQPVLSTRLFPVLAQEVETAGGDSEAEPQVVWGEACDTGIPSPLVLSAARPQLIGPLPPEKAPPGGQR